MTAGRNRLAANGGCFCGHAWTIHDKGGCIGCDCGQQAPPRHKSGSPLDAGGGGMLAVDQIGTNTAIDPETARKARLVIAEAALRVQERMPAVDAREFAIDIMANLGLDTASSLEGDVGKNGPRWAKCEECGEKYLPAIYDPQKPNANTARGPQRYCSERCRKRVEQRRLYMRSKGKV